jgi:hypothetical protein
MPKKARSNVSSLTPVPKHSSSTRKRYWRVLLARWRHLPVARVQTGKTRRREHIRCLVTRKWTRCSCELSGLPKYWPRLKCLHPHRRTNDPPAETPCSGQIAAKHKPRI